MRALRPDRMLYALNLFVEEKLGRKYVEDRTIDFSKSYQEMTTSTPIFFSYYLCF
jgi:dynein heavy chain